MVKGQTAFNAFSNAENGNMFVCIEGENKGRVAYVQSNLALAWWNLLWEEDNAPVMHSEAYSVAWMTYDEIEEAKNMLPYAYSMSGNYNWVAGIILAKDKEDAKQKVEAHYDWIPNDAEIKCINVDDILLNDNGIMELMKHQE